MVLGSPNGHLKKLFFNNMTKEITMSDLQVSLDLDTEMITIQEVCGFIGFDHTLSIDEFRKYFEIGGEYAKAPRTQMVQRLIEMDFDITSLKEFYDNQV
jgi:hypothetical protein